MSDRTSADVRTHSLSPSAWNRYETCPRMYWLSRQRLPRKAGMAASLGTAVHASVEDLLLNDISHIGDAESGWMPDFAHQVLKARWEEEKAIFSQPLDALSGKRTNGKRPFAIKKEPL